MTIAKITAIIASSRARDFRGFAAAWSDGGAASGKWVRGLPQAEQKRAESALETPHRRPDPRQHCSIRTAHSQRTPRSTYRTNHWDRRLAIEVNNPTPDGESHRVGTVGGAQLAENVLQVHLNGARGSAELSANFLVS